MQNLKAEITSRIQATSNSYHNLKQRVFENHDTLYCYKIKLLRTVQQRHLISILKIRWNDFVSNETVLTRSNVVDIKTLLAQNRLRWLDHLCRMGDNQTIKFMSLKKKN